MSGLLIDGHVVPVPGVTVLTPDTTPGLRVPAYRTRTMWVRQYILHKTIADDPEHLLTPDVGPPNGDLQTLEAWSGGVNGAHLVTGYDGRTCCVVDLRRSVTYHATASNGWSVGHELKEKSGGGVYPATIRAAVAVCLAACRALGIQLQMPKLGTYTGHPIARMADPGATPGGPDMVGIFGHRDNTERRGRWDPGDLVFQALAAAGVEQFDFAAGQDRDTWGHRQRGLNRVRGYDLTEDGVPGPATVAALKKAGFADGIWVSGSPALLGQIPK